MSRDLKELGNTIVALQREAVKQTLQYWKPEEIGRAHV